MSRDQIKHENLVVLGDFNKESQSFNSDKDYLDNFYDLFNLTNLVHSETCLTRKTGSL